MNAIAQWAVFLAVIAALIAAWRLSRHSRRGRRTAGYVRGAVLVFLGLPLLFGYVGAIFPLVVGVAVLIRTRRAYG